MSDTTTLKHAAQASCYMRLSDEEAKQLLENSDLLDMFRYAGWYSAPASSFRRHGMALIKQIETAINAKVEK